MDTSNHVEKSSNNNTSCNFSALSQLPSISDIIQPLRSSFLESDFDKAEQQLIARENNLKEERETMVGTLKAKCDALELELDELRAQKNGVEEQLRRLKGDCEKNEQKIRDLTRDLCLVKDKEVKFKKKNDDLLVKLKEWEAYQKELIPIMADLRDEVENLKGKLRVKVEEIDGFCRKNEVLEDEQNKLKGHVEKMEEICRENEVLKEEIGKVNALFIEVKREKNERVREQMEKEKPKIKVLEDIVRVYIDQGEEIKGIRKRNASLEDKNVELSACLEELRRNDAVKCEKIKDLLMKNEALVREKREAVREKDEKIYELEKEKDSQAMKLREVSAKFGRVEDRFLKLMEDLFTGFRIISKRDGILASSTQMGRFLAEIERAFYSEGFGITCRTEGIDCCVKSGGAHMSLVSEAKKPKENRRSRCTEENFVVLDSDDDNENLINVTSVKHSEKVTEQLNFDRSIDGNLGLKQKKMKFGHALNEPVYLGSSNPICYK